VALTSHRTLCGFSPQACSYTYLSPTLPSHSQARRHLQVIDTDPGPGLLHGFFRDELDPEQALERDEELVKPLRRVLGSLLHLTRLRLKGVDPLPSVFTELAPIEVRSASCIVC